jgi:putative metallohydrolase (TIGR04338 family)
MSASCQQFELYAAERRVSTGERFPSVAAMQAFVDGLRNTWWWRQFYPNVARVEVYSRPSNRHESVGAYDAAKRAGHIEMLPVHWTPLVVLHELAHVLAKARYGSRAHDPAFARVYLELVYLELGYATYVELERAFTAAGINFDHDDPALGRARRMPAGDSSHS